MSSRGLTGHCKVMWQGPSSPWCKPVNLQLYLLFFYVMIKELKLNSKSSFYKLFVLSLSFCTATHCMLHFLPYWSVCNYETYYYTSTLVTVTGINRVFIFIFIFFFFTSHIIYNNQEVLCNNKKHFIFLTDRYFIFICGGESSIRRQFLSLFQMDVFTQFCFLLFCNTFYMSF